jgi:DNA primase large subunit
MSDDKFSKEYKYNIRHSYGQEGKRQNYQAKRYGLGSCSWLSLSSDTDSLFVPYHSCQQILTGPQPGAQESHGCPYRHFSPEHLQTFLIEAYPGSLHPGSMEMREVMDSVKKTHYHVACTRVFELTHQANVKKGEGLGGGAAVTHPNEYFSKSLEYEK